MVCLYTSCEILSVFLAGWNEVTEQAMKVWDGLEDLTVNEESMMTGQLVKGLVGDALFQIEQSICPIWEIYLAWKSSESASCATIDFNGYYGIFL